MLAAEMFRRYADDGATIAELARWLTSQGVPIRTGKHRWDGSVIWGMLRNPPTPGVPSSARPRSSTSSRG